MPSPGQPHPFLRAGVPLLGLTIGGFLGLRFFLQGRFDVQVRRRAPHTRHSTAGLASA